LGHQGSTGLPIRRLLPSGKLAQGQIAAQSQGSGRGLEALPQMEGRREPITSLFGSGGVLGVPSGG
jgi:hypothetical protein